MSQTYSLHTQYRKRLADTITPVSIYLQIRDRFANPILLESSDYRGQDNSYSYICFNPLASFSLTAGKVLEKMPDGQENSYTVSSEQPLMDCLRRFGNAFQSSPDSFKFSTNGLFGYTQYDTVGWFEDIQLQGTPSQEVPMMHYAMYQNIIVVDHYKNELHLFEHLPEGAVRASYLDEIETLLNNKNIPAYSFKKVGEEFSNYSDAEFLELLGKAQKHCQRGDVFQLVLSRRFTTAFKGFKCPIPKLKNTRETIFKNTTNRKLWDLLIIRIRIHILICIYIQFSI